MAGRTVPCYNGSGKKHFAKGAKTTRLKQPDTLSFLYLSFVSLYCVGDDYP